MENREIIEIITNLLENESLTAREIKDKNIDFFEDISIQKLARILSNNFTQINLKSPYRYRNTNNLIMTGNIEKIKNILKIELNDGNFLEYDFNTGEMSKNLNLYDNIKTLKENSLINVFMHNKLRKIEWLYNYPELLSNNLCDYDAYDLEECPKGYINWLIKNNEMITGGSVREYKNELKYSAIPFNILKNIEERYKSEEMLPICDDLFKNVNFKKVLKNSFEKMELSILEDFIELLRNIIDTKRNDYKDYIDTNRTIKDNIVNMQLLKWENLCANLKRMNFINGLEIDKYIIVVPQTIEDLILEGKNQNNCVGHYYNNSIEKGENLIYFIRNKEHKEKSLITCRYNIKSKKTVEYRTKNNNSTTKEQDTIIKSIDKIIKENLK